MVEDSEDCIAYRGDIGVFDPPAKMALGFEGSCDRID